MKITLTFIIGLLMFTAGCTSSQPAPKPFNWGSSADTKAAEQKVKQMEAQSPCSEENLRSASDKQRHDCDPLQDVFDTANKARQKTAATRKQPAQTTHKN